MRLRYSPLAIRHLYALHDYIAARNPAAATGVIRRIKQTIGLLQVLPDMGRPGTRRGTREIRVPHLPYVVVYRIEQDGGALDILGVYHTAQRRPGQRL